MEQRRRVTTTTTTTTRTRRLTTTTSEFPGFSNLNIFETLKPFSLSYGDQYAEQGAQSSELVAKQEDGGLFSSVDRIFFGGQGLALPLAITLFLVDIVVSGIF